MGGKERKQGRRKERGEEEKGEEEGRKVVGEGTIALMKYSNIICVNEPVSNWCGQHFFWICYQNCPI